MKKEEVIQQGIAHRSARRAARAWGIASAVFILQTVALVAEPVPITSLSVLHNLTSQQASHSLPVAFEGTVTYYAKGSFDLFVEDAGVAIYVQSFTNLDLSPGDRVLVRGRTRASFRPDIVADTVTRIGRGALPAPVTASYERLIRAELDCMRVTVTGRVRSANLVTYGRIYNVYLELQVDGGYVDATIASRDGSILKELLDAEVSVTGSAAGKFDSKNQMTGILIEVPSILDLKILKPAASSPESLPITPIDNILQHAFVQDQTERVRVGGSITYYLPGGAVVLQNGTGSLWIETKDEQPLSIGDMATASGFPAVRDGVLTLTSAEIEDSHVHSPVAPQNIGWTDLSSGSDAFELISIEGRVVKESRENSQDEYVLTSGGHLFSVLYQHPDLDLGFDLPPMKNIPVGAMVRVTGISWVSYGPNPFVGPAGFDVVLRSSDDITVIAKPSWINVSNLTRLVEGLIVVILLFAVRVVWTERKARRRDASMAYIERRRSEILEDINNSHPVEQILVGITELVSFRLHGAACWCEIAGAAHMGNKPQKITSQRTIQQEISGRSGTSLGTIFAAINRMRKPDTEETAALSQGASLTSLAIETSHLYADLIHRSEFDLLTDVENRFSLERRLDKAIASARASAGVFGLFYVDLNDFKQVNDVYGHRAGDLYLQQVAARVKHRLRPGDMLARIGGDEFAVLLPDVRNCAEAGEVAGRLERCFDEPFECEGVTVVGSASIGIAMYPADGTTRDSLLSAADASMYVAKQTREL